MTHHPSYAGPSQMDETSIPCPDPWTWLVFNASTQQFVNEPELLSTQTFDQAWREACQWLIDEADKQTEPVDAEWLDHAAQDLNVNRFYAFVGGSFDWEINVVNIKTYQEINTPIVPETKKWSIRIFETNQADHVATFEPVCTEEAVYEWREQTERLFGDQFVIMIDPAV